VAKGDPPGPKGGRCPRCLRETGALKLHVPYCQGEEAQRSEGSVRALPNYEVLHHRSRPAPLIGGPLHGYVLPPTKGPRPHYLDEVGMILPVRSGDRFMRREGVPRRKGIYVLHREGKLHFWYVWKLPRS
jgi:hypothetical protein